MGDLVRMKFTVVFIVLIVVGQYEQLTNASGLLFQLVVCHRSCQGLYCGSNPKPTRLKGKHDNQYG